eukprot:Gb_26248 [translate_table: standard]
MHLIPSALIIFMVGIIINIARKPEILKQLKIGPSKIHLISISKDDWKTGFIRAAIPQIPFSILNYVIAVCKLSTNMFPHKEVVSATFMSVSVGVMNLVGCWFGAMPMCYGEGGLAGQYHFGARSRAPVAFLGIAKESFVMLMCSAISLTGSSAALGFGCGIALYALLKLRVMDFVDLLQPLFNKKIIKDHGLVWSRIIWHHIHNAVGEQGQEDIRGGNGNGVGRGGQEIHNQKMKSVRGKGREWGGRTQDQGMG